MLNVKAWSYEVETGELAPIAGEIQFDNR